MSSELNVNYELAQRLQAFIRSDLFAVSSHIAKSEYWKYYADQLRATVSADSVIAEGDSGFYVPQKGTAIHLAARKVRQGILHPSKAINWAVGQLMARGSVPRLMSYEKGFDAVMNCLDVAEPVLSPFRINHAKLAKNQNVFTNTASLKQHYQSWS